MLRHQQGSDQGNNAPQAQLLDAATFVQKMNLRDPRLYPHRSFHKLLRVRETINAWSPIPTHDHTFLFSQLGVHTDGSALLSKRWPAVPANAGWGAIFVGI